MICDQCGEELDDYAECFCGLGRPVDPALRAKVRASPNARPRGRANYSGDSMRTMVARRLERLRSAKG